MHGSLPGLRCFSSVLRAEIFALAKLLECDTPPLRVGIDNSTVIRGLCRGSRWCLRPSRPHSDLWARV
eukprot:3594042-Pyramimonas_sp.AAC.1